MLVVERATRPDVDFRYRIFNADGGEVEQCGNGARCFVKFVRDHGYTEAPRIRVETAGGIIVPEVVAGGEVTVDMGVPRFAPSEIPFVADGDADAVVRQLDVDGETIEITVRVDGQSARRSGRRRCRPCARRPRRARDSSTIRGSRNG